MQTVLRLDYARLDGKAERTPQGGLRVPARLTRTGVLTYRRADGSVVREYRPADEVFRADSLATLRGAPVTDLHPPEGFVDPTTWRARSAGHVADSSVRQDGEFVAGDIVAQDGTLVAAIERRDRQEISCGYRCRLDATPGVHEGEPYDVVQRNIVYNHVALLPRGAGRAGSEVSLRLDSSAAVLADPPTDCPAPTGPENKRNDSMKTIRIDGIDYQVDSPGFEQAFGKAMARLDSLTAEVVAAKKTADETQAKLDAAEKELAETKTKLAEAADPKRLDSLAAERVTLITGARKIAGDELKLDGLSDREIMAAALAAVDPEIKLDGKSDDYVRARFDAEVARGRTNQVVPATNSVADARRASTPTGSEQRNDAAERRAKAIEARNNAWRKPGDMTSRSAS